MNNIVEVKGKLGFGQYAMSKWEDVPKEYLEYFVSNGCGVGFEVKEKAKIELNNRKIKFPVSGL